MASLLDLYIQRNMPTAGLLARDGGGLPSPDPASPRPGDVGDLLAPTASPTPQSPPSEGGGGGNFLDRLFGTEPQNTRQAMLEAGLATIASDKEGLAALAEGLLTGRKGARDRQRVQFAQDMAEQRTEIADRSVSVREEKFASEMAAVEEGRTRGQQLADKYAQIFSDGGRVRPEEVDQALQVAIRNRDFDAATELRQLRSQFEDEGTVLKTIRRGDMQMTARVMPDGTLVDAVTGEPLSESMFQKMAEPRDPKERQDRINALSDDARSDLIEARDVATAVRIGSSVPNNRAGATTLFTMMTRAIDPGVSVRDADIKRGEAAATLKGRALNLYNLWLREGQLDGEQFAWLQNELRRVGREQQKAFEANRNFWRRRAEDARVDPDLVLPPDSFEGIDMAPIPVPGENDDDEDPGPPGSADEAVNRIGS